MTSGCATTSLTGDAGCATFHDRVLAAPDDKVPESPWGDWIADTFNAMTGTCR